MSQKIGISIAVLSRREDDVELINAALRGAGHAAHCRWIADPAQYDDVLGVDTLELIILFAEDYPDDLRQVVNQKNTFCPEVPIVALQSEVDETAIQSALQLGARDLVSRGMQSRWLAVIERELRALRLERALNVTVTAASEYKRQLNNYLERSGSPIAYAQDGIVTSANPAWIELFGSASEEEVIGLPLMDSFETESHAAIKGALIATAKGKWQKDEKLQVNYRNDKDDAAALELCFGLVEFEDGPHVQVEIAAPEAQSEEPTKLVHDALQRDPTTLFFNRSQFLDRLQKRLKKKPASGVQLLACLRPDHFSTVQKDVGIIDSEEVLAQLAEQLRLRLHSQDFAGRFDGTSMMVLLERGSEDDALTWGQQTVDQIHDAEFTIGEKAVSVTCTIGICAVRGVFADLEELIAATLAAQREGCESGGNTVQLSGSDSSDSRLRHFDEVWVQHIRAALMDNRFRLAQLPIAGLRSEANGMCDMLVRMLDEHGQSVLPSEFLPAAERNNLMKTIDRWMLTAAMDFCRDENADLVFVRLSRQTLQDGLLIDWVTEELRKRQLPPRKLCVQVAERDAAKHIKLAKALADGFRQIGVPFALSHYGVGQTRLKILDILKPDYLKIDGALMHSLMSDTDVQNNVRILAEACEQRSILTIAERVENANEMAILFQLGVHFMQGHYVQEPEVVLDERPAVPSSSLDAIVNS